MSLSNSPARISTSQKIRNILSSSRRGSSGSITSPRSESPIVSTPTSSLNNSPVRITIPKCHQCRRDLIVDNSKDLFLAIKCRCPEPPYYFCTPECNRTHWLTLHTRGESCEYYDFQEYIDKYNEFPLSQPLEWTNISNIHNLYHYIENMLYK